MKEEERGNIKRREEKCKKKRGVLLKQERRNLKRREEKCKKKRGELRKEK